MGRNKLNEEERKRAGKSIFAKVGKRASMRETEKARDELPA